MENDAVGIVLDHLTPEVQVRILQSTISALVDEVEFAVAERDDAARVADSQRQMIGDGIEANDKLRDRISKLGVEANELRRDLERANSRLQHALDALYLAATGTNGGELGWRETESMMADFCVRLYHPTKKITAIKLLRAMTGPSMGLREAKEAIDAAIARREDAYIGTGAI